MSFLVHLLVNWLNLLLQFSLAVHATGIAVFRVLFVRAQMWLTKTVGIKTMLVAMLLFGFGLILTFAFLTITHDRTGVLRKMCFYQSSADLDIMEAYEVYSQ